MTIVGADLYGDVPDAAPASWRVLFPGMVVVLLGTLAANFLSDHYGAPLTLMALLLGLSLNFLSNDARLTPGLTFSSRSLLRWGIVLVGARVTMAEIVGLGPLALLCVAIVVAVTMIAGVLASRQLGLTAPFGVLAGGAVAICGASAAMALSTTLGERRVSERDLTIVLVGISAASAAAMVLYPIAAHLLDLPDMRAGFLLGASIHDVAQALGAGYAFSPAAGRIAAIVKLTRVALLAPVLACVSAIVGRGGTNGTRMSPVPWFVVGFFALAGINSMNVIPRVVADGASRIAAAFLTAAVTSTAIRSPLPQLLDAGIKPILVILIATVTAFILALAAALWVIR